VIIIRIVRENRIATAFLASLTLVTFYLIQIATSWHGLRSAGIRGSSNYIDQESVLNSAICFKSLGINVYKLDVEPIGCGGFVYSIELLRFLNVTNLSSIDSSVLGTALMWLTIATLCSLLFIIKKHGKIDNIIALVSLSSPGIWLLLERGNYDEIIFILIVVASMLLTSKYQEVGIILIFATVLIKFYTLPLYIFSLFILRRRLSRNFFLVTSIPLTMYVLYLIREIAAFPSTWFVSFGLKSLGLYAELVVNEKISEQFRIPSTISILIGMFLLIFFLLFFRQIRMKPAFVQKAESPNLIAKAVYKSLLIVFLSCYFAGMNFDYRLILVASMIAISPAVFINNRFRSMMLFSGIISLWLSSYSFGLDGLPELALQFLGDITLYAFVATQLLLIYFVLKPYFVKRFEVIVPR
jgi:hypothetical protein